MIAVSLATIISFVSFYSHSDFMEKGSSSHVGSLYGRTISMPTAQRGIRLGDLARNLAQADRNMMDLYRALALSANQQDPRDNFLWNNMILQHEAENLGITVTDDEIFAAMSAMPFFQTNGAYDSQKYAAFIKNYLGPMGLGDDDFSNLVASSIRLQKVKALLGATVAPSEGEIRNYFTQLNQKTEASVVRFKTDDFLAATQVPEEDIKKLFEERKASLKTDELRKVRFVSFILPTTDKPLTGTARADKLTELQKKAEDFSVAMTAKDAKFDEVAAKFEAKVQDSPDFSVAKPPEALEASSEIAAAAFKLTQQEPLSDVLTTPRGYYVLQLANVTPPRPLTFEEAKADLTDSLKHERAQEALNLKAAEVHNKIEAAMKAGKTFAAAAQELGVKVEDFPAFSRREPKMDAPNAMEVMQTASEMNEGQLSAVTPSADGSLIVYVTKRLPIDEDKLKAEKAQIVEGITEFQQLALFQQWLKLRRAAAQLQTSFRA